jgi:cytochrome P450
VTAQQGELSLTADFLVDPYSAYDRMRAEAPAHRIRLAGTDVHVWLVTGWAVARRLLTDPRITKSAAKVGFSLAATRMPVYSASTDQLRGNMLHADPPEHSRLRRPVHDAFTPVRVQVLRDWVQQAADELVDRIAPLGRADVVADLARPLPGIVVAELFGTPEEHRADLHRWSRAVVAAPTTGEEYAAFGEALREIHSYLKFLVELRRREPDDGLVTALVRVHDEESDQSLSDDELLSTLFLLLFAGLENVGDLISNGTLALLRNPEQLARLRRDPDLMRTAVDEFLRYDSPGNITTWRFATADIDVGDGVVIPRGEPVLVAMPAVNRDPTRFADPHRLDLDRTDNPHISFGHGVHHCPGLHLARLEGEIAIGTLLRRLPDLALAVPAEELVYKPSVLVRGLESLPVRFTPIPPS